MSKPICTKESPAPGGQPWSCGCNHSRNWNREYEHPDEKWESMDGDHEDYRCTCPNCGQSKISEGADA